jgi:NitT/TauT family transport system permease protein
MARSQVVEWAVNPFIDALYSTPPIAYIPLIIVWLGLQFKARVFMVFAMCFFEILINTHQGIDSIDDAYLDVGKSFDASWLATQRRVLLPASLPHIFAGLRLGAGRAVRGMIVAELFLAVVNLGSLLELAGRTYQIDKQLAIIVTITLTGVLFQQAIVFVEHRTIPWHFTAGEE